MGDEHTLCSLVAFVLCVFAWWLGYFLRGRFLVSPRLDVEDYDSTKDTVLMVTYRRLNNEQREMLKRQWEDAFTETPKITPRGVVLHRGMHPRILRAPTQNSALEDK